MPTCPNCGSIVMEGDPYCSHCGAHFKWNHAGEVEDASQETRASQSLYDVAEESHDDDFVPGSYDEPDDFLDYGEVSETYFEASEETLEYIADHVCATSPQKLQLKAKIRQYMKARDFNGFYIRKESGFEVYYFHFIQENEYVKSTHVMIFIQDPNYYSPYHAFHDFYSLHSHDGLLRNPRFKRLIESVGHEFDGCQGGYETHLANSFSDITLTGEIKVKVYFNVGRNRRVYKLNLDEMELSSDYDEYDPEEYF